MPADGVDLQPEDKLLNSSEILRIATLFARYGVYKIRLTGGEPLVRKDCVQLMKEMRKIPGIENVSITTNGIALKRKLEDLQDAGLGTLNLSLDTLDPAKFEQITRRRGFSAVWESLQKMIEMDFATVKACL
jgi:molybdenum cofactor biosynthesis enzyme MoaA